MVLEVTCLATTADDSLAEDGFLLATSHINHNPRPQSYWKNFYSHFDVIEIPVRL